MIWYDIRHGKVWYDMMLWFGVVWYDILCYVTIRYDIWYDMIW